MAQSHDIGDLTGQLLIAMPGMGDPRFETSVILMCAHTDEAAMGLIVNKTISELSFSDLLAQLEIETGGRRPDLEVHFGGPVERGRGFVLHSDDYEGTGSTLTVGESFAMTATLDILSDIVQGRGPRQAILALGYAGWGAGQLEGEILANGWLTCPASPEIVFAPNHGGKWQAALGALGIDPRTLSGAAGRA